MAGSSISISHGAVGISRSVAIPIVSQQALQRMTLLRLAQSDEVDNVLLEWTLMLVLFDAGVLPSVLPLILGDSWANDGALGRLDFTEFKD